MAKSRDTAHDPDGPVEAVTAEPDQADADRAVDMAGMDSFPASDPPGWWAGTGLDRPATDEST